MDISSATRFVWQLAASEAANAGFTEIHPENFLVSLLKLTELDNRQLQKVGCGVEEVGEIRGEILGMRECIQANGINSTVVRRTLRGLLGSGPGVNEVGVMHRSNTSRIYFDQAASDANHQGEERLTTVRLLHTLLASPTPKTAEALGGKHTGAPGCGQDTPVLNEWGKEFHVQAGKEVDREASLLPPEVMVLRKVLEESHSSRIFLVADYPQLVHAVVARVAGIIRGKGEGVSARFIDLSAIIDATITNESVIKVEQAMGELAHLQGAVVYIPLIKVDGEHSAHRDVLNILHKYSMGSGARWICGIGTSIYRNAIAGDISWKRIARTIWLSPKQSRDLPSKL